MKRDEMRVDVGEPVPAEAAGALKPIVRDFTRSGMEPLTALKEEMLDLEESIRDIKAFGGPRPQRKLTS